MIEITGIAIVPTLQNSRACDPGNGSFAKANPASDATMTVHAAAPVARIAELTISRPSASDWNSVLQFAVE